jgi:MtfA peptidase
MTLYILLLLLTVCLVAWWKLRVRRPLQQEEYFENTQLTETIARDRTAAPTTQELSVPLVYYGHELQFSDELLTRILHKHFTYFNRLLDVDREKFIRRLKKFIESKVFIIHDAKGYREMPVLLSASAIQLTFGLKHYQLSHFNIIQIYPQEFIGLEPFRVLIGNVTGNTINIAWKQFLEGYAKKQGNQNVGLHEMAHALYYQNFETDLQTDKNFRDNFQRFNNIGDQIFRKEIQSPVGLYSHYAMKNFQEFWAESIEIYFENPLKMQQLYPDLYSTMCEILNQDPILYPHHLFGNN